MNDAESAESKKKLNFSDFYFASYGHFCLFLSLIFDEFFTMTQKIKNWVKTEGGGSTYPSLGKSPKATMSQKLKIDMTTSEEKKFCPWKYPVS